MARGTSQSIDLVHSMVPAESVMRASTVIHAVIIGLGAAGVSDLMVLPFGLSVFISDISDDMQYCVCNVVEFIFIFYLIINVNI